MKLFHLLMLGTVLAMSTSFAVAQASSATMSSGASPSKADCVKASKLRHDHAAESGRGTPRPVAKDCPPAASAASASAAATAAAKKKARHDHQSTK